MSLGKYNQATHYFLYATLQGPLYTCTLLLSAYIQHSGGQDSVYPVYQAIITVHATLPIEKFHSHWGWGPCSRLITPSLPTQKYQTSHSFLG